jgi:O-antigen ligase
MLISDSLSRVRAPTVGLAASRNKSRLALWREDAVDQAVFWAFVGALAWCPYYYGGNVLLAWGINAILFPGLAAFYEVSLLVRWRRHPTSIREFGASALLFVAVVLWILIQNATWTPAFLHHPIWAMAAEDLGGPVEGSISVNRDLTTLALVRLMTAAGVFWLAVQLCRDRTRARTFMMVIAAIICGYAAYGLVAFAMASGPVSWFGETPVRGFVRSTFINRNHFATYAGIGFVAVCCLNLRLYRRYAVPPGGSFSFRLAFLIEVIGQRGAVLMGAAFLLLVAILLTGSRGGMLATGLGVAVLGVLWFAQPRKPQVRKGSGTGVLGTLLIALALLVIVVAVFSEFGDTFFGKVAEGGATDSNRLAVYVMTLRSINDSLLLGYGYGTFSDVFPMFRDHSISVEGVWVQAHNTYLELFQGLGVVFGAMLLASVALLVLKCFRGATAQRDGVTAPTIAVSVACLVGVHALVDFSLQIQAVTLTFMAVLGAGVAQSDSSWRLLSEVSDVAQSFAVRR